MSHVVGVGDWSVSSGIEPSVRIGVVLDEDGDALLRLCPPKVPHALAGIDESDIVLTGGPAAEAPTPTIEARKDGDRVAVALAGKPIGTARVLRLSPVQDVPVGRGVGICVHDVVAGRGFHWHKRIDQYLAGTVEIRAGARGLILINELPLEMYLAGVITSEMSGDCPAALLEAQCVVARSWLLAMTEPKHVDEPFDRCNDDCCQRYQGTGDLSETAIAAAANTRGLILLDPAGDVLDANYAKSCGGLSERPEAVWGVEKPGISAIVDAPEGASEGRFMPLDSESKLDEFLDGAWLADTKIYCSPHSVSGKAIARYLGRVDEVDDYFRWTVSYERCELEALLREKLSVADDLVELRDLQVVERGVSGRASKVDVVWQSTGGVEKCERLESEYRIRQVLHRGFLYSSAISIRTQRDADGRISSVTLRGAGWGHGVGMCQIGALGMAMQGLDCGRICRHYYPEARQERVYR